MSRKLKLIISILCVYIIWGSTYLGIRIVLETVPPFMIGALRFLSAGLLMFAYAKITTGEKITPAHLKSTAIVGLLLLFVANGGVIWVEQYISSGLTALIISLVPLMMVLIEWMAPKGKRPPNAVFIGIAFGIVGTGVLMSDDLFTAPGTVVYISVAILFLSMLSWSGGSIYSRYAKLPKSPSLSVSLEMLWAGAAFIIVSLSLGELSGGFPEISLRSWAALVYLATFGSIIAFSAYIWLLHNTTPALTSTYAFVNPAVALFLGWLLVGEPITYRTLVASALIIIGVIIITSLKKNGKPEENDNSIRIEK